MKVREAMIAALRGDPVFGPRLTAALRQRIEGNGGAMSTVVQAAEALEPIIEEAVRKRPSRLGKVGLKSAHLLANLATEDPKANKELARIAHGSTIGIVFVDVANFTNYTVEQGDEAAIQLLSKLGRVVDAKARSCKGKRVKSLGDGFLLAFPSASQAVRAALALREAVWKGRRDDASFDVRLRIAVHAGEPLVEQDDLFGHDVNLTARLLDHCKPDEVIVSRTAKEIAEKRLRKVEFGKEKRVKIRGLAGRKTVYTANPLTEPSQNVNGSRTRRQVAL